MPDASELTLYAETGKHVGRLVARAELDEVALSTPLRPCELSRCHGTCCHDGVRLGDEEAQKLRRLVLEHAERLEASGVEGEPETWLTTDPDSGHPRTATRPLPMRELVTDYPAHFPETGCVFLVDGARCALQMLSVDLGHHPWYLKPLTCWIHPLAIVSTDGHPILLLHREDTDPQRRPGYDGFNCRTHCGRAEADGQPGWRVLHEELEALGNLGERDLLAELEATGS